MGSAVSLTALCLDMNVYVSQTSRRFCVAVSLGEEKCPCPLLHVVVRVLSGPQHMANESIHLGKC